MKLQQPFKAIILAASILFSNALFAGEININSADAQTISDNLNGIGLKKAEAIVTWRTENGEFKELAELQQVKGIGIKTLEKNKENIKF